MILAFADGFIWERIPAAINYLALLEQFQMIVDLLIFQLFRVINTLLSLNDEVVVLLLCPMHKRLILLGEAEGSQRVRYHLLRLDRVVVLLVRYQATHRILRVLDLRELHVKHFDEDIQVLLEVCLFKLLSDVEIALFELVLHLGLDVAELLEHVVELLLLVHLISFHALNKLPLCVLIVPHFSAGLGAHLANEGHVASDVVPEDVVVLVQVVHFLLDMVHFLVVCDGHLDSIIQLLLGSIEEFFECFVPLLRIISHHIDLVFDFEHTFIERGDILANFIYLLDLRLMGVNHLLRF